MASGEIIDPTIRQFRWWRKGMAVDREDIGYIRPREFFALFEAEYLWSWCPKGEHFRTFAKWVGPVISENRKIRA